MVDGDVDVRVGVGGGAGWCARLGAEEGREEGGGILLGKAGAGGDGRRVKERAVTGAVVGGLGVIVSWETKPFHFTKWSTVHCQQAVFHIGRSPRHDSNSGSPVRI